MDKAPTHDFERYSAYIARRSREEDSKSSIIPKHISKEDDALEAQVPYEGMEPAEITIDDEENTMNIDLNLDAYTDFTNQEFTVDVCAYIRCHQIFSVQVLIMNKVRHFEIKTGNNE